MTDTLRPRRGKECRYRFDDSSCRIHRDAVCKPGSRACAQGLKPEPIDPPPPALFDQPTDERRR